MEIRELSLSDILEYALKTGIIDRYCIDRDNIRFWQGNLRLQFDRQEAHSFLAALVRAYDRAVKDELPEG